MWRKLLFPVILGLGGIAVLVSLGVWQMQRLDWKLGVIADAEAQIAAPPVALPDAPDQEAWNRRAVAVAGVLTGDEILVLTSGTSAGTGYRVIAALDTGDRRVMADLGLLPLDGRDAPAMTGPVEITGNLQWPDDVNSSTPAPDRDEGLWFARDVASMAEALAAAPLLVTVATMSPPDPRVTPLPVDTRDFKNDHWEYAVTWFSLALVWAAMSLFLIRRIVKGTA